MSDDDTPAEEAGTTSPDESGESSERGPRLYGPAPGAAESTGDDRPSDPRAVDEETGSPASPNETGDAGQRDRADDSTEMSPYGGLTLGFETRALLVVAALATIGCFAAVFLDIPGWLSGDTDIFGNYRYAEKIEQRRRDFTPLERVHAELFPQWLVHAARPPERRSEGKLEETHEKLRSNLSDAKLRGVVTDLKEWIDAGTIGQNPRRVIDAMDRWNRRLEELDEPFFARLRTATRRGRTFVYGAFYRRMAQPALTVGDAQYEALLLRRIDSTNLFESFLGLTREDAPYAFVVTDRVLDFAIQDVLPVVAAGTEAKAEGDGGFARVPSLDDVSTQFEKQVREGLRRGLGDEQYRNLEKAARARTRLSEAVDSIRSRRECSNFRISNPSWNGYTPRTLDRLDAFAAQDELDDCPTVTYREADAVRATTELLQTDGSERAFESTVAYLSRVIAIHEARHRADNATDDDGDGAPSCSSCPEDLSADTRSELSAYTASFAWADSPAVALFQACKSNIGGAHFSAVAYYLDRLGTLCDQPIPSDLGERSRKIEKELFGRSEQVLLPDDFPDRLDIRVW